MFARLTTLILWFQFLRNTISPQKDRNPIIVSEFSLNSKRTSLQLKFGVLLEIIR